MIRNGKEGNDDMKCKECGSGDIRCYHWDDTGDEYTCNNCGNEDFADELCREDTESLLERFERVDDDIFRFKVSQSTDDVYILYIISQKVFKTRGLRLLNDTVRSIIKDVDRHMEIKKFMEDYRGFVNANKYIKLMHLYGVAYAREQFEKDLKAGKLPIK